MRYGWLIAFLAPLLAACGESEPVEEETVPAVEVEKPAEVEIPEEFREKIESLALAASTRPEDQRKAWQAFRSLRDSGEEALGAILRIPDADRPLLAMLKAWMKSVARADLGLTALGDELAFLEEIESVDRRGMMVFRLERSAAEGRSSETVEVDGTGGLSVEWTGDGVSTSDTRQLEDAEFLPILDLLVNMKFWLQRGIRQAGSKDEALLTVSQFRKEGGERVLVRRIEVWETEATLSFNRPLWLIVALFREFARPQEK